MKTIARLIIIIAAISLSAVVVSWHIVSILGSPTAINTALERGGAYDQAARQLQDKLKRDIAEGTNVTTEAVLNRSVEQAVNAQLMQVVISPHLRDLTDWLHGTSDAVPDITIDASRIKQAVIQTASAAVPAELSGQIRFEVTRVLPDSVPLLGADDRTAAQTAASLQSVKRTYDRLQRDLVIELAVTLGLLFGLVVLGVRNRRQMVRRPAEVFLLAAVLVALISYPMQFIISSTILSSGNFTAGQGSELDLIRSLTGYTLNGLLPYAVGLAVIGCLLFAVSLFLPKPARKHVD